MLKMTTRSLVIALVVAFVAPAANAVTIDVVKNRNARIVELDEDTIKFQPRNKRRKAVSVLSVSVAPDEEMTAEVVFRNKRKRLVSYEVALHEGVNEFVLKGKKPKTVTFKGGKKVPEPAMAMLLGLSLAGAAALRRRS